MEKITVVIPKKDNDGKAFPVKTIDSIEESFLQLANGFSRSDIIGKWIDNGQVYTDTSFRYDIVTDEKTAAMVKAYIAQAKVVLSQLSMYYEHSKTDVEFI